MSKPKKNMGIRPEDSIKKPRNIDDSLLIGLTDLVDRKLHGEDALTSLADTLNVFSSILRQIISGDEPSGGYLDAPDISLKEIKDRINDLGTSVWKTSGIPTKGTPMCTSGVEGTVMPMTSALGPEFMFIGLAGSDATEEGQELEIKTPGQEIAAFENLLPNTPYMIQPDGTLGTSMPLFNNHRVQILGIAKNSTTLVIKDREPKIRKTDFLS